MEEEKEINIRSEEVQEVLSHVPNWMIRWGITLIFGLILMVLVLSWFIKYPEVIDGSINITTETAPIKLTSQINGRIRSEEHTSELQSRPHLVCRLLLEKKNPLLIRRHLILCIYLAFRLVACRARVNARNAFLRSRFVLGRVCLSSTVHLCTRFLPVH